MTDIRNDVLYAVLNKSYALIDNDTGRDTHKTYEFRKQIILDDKSLTENEKFEAIKIITKTYDLNKLIFDQGAKRICENCNQECLATLFCEHCVRNYLKSNFPKWTSGNDNIDNLIQECQMKTISPDKIPEWIPYNNLEDIEYLTKGGFSEIYKAVWVDGYYIEWDSKKQQLVRFGSHYVVLKRLENVENANQRWLEEARSHLTVSNKWSDVVQCYGLTRDPSNGNYMLVMNILDTDLRKYLQQNHNQLTWKEKRDQNFRVSDLGFCGPANRPLKSIYGNLPYLAPEVIVGKEQTFKSDIYSIAILMWEISSGRPPFFNSEHNYYLAMNIVNGIRPNIVPGTPLEYKNLMIQCWDADPSKRPDIFTLARRMRGVNLFYQSKSNESLFQLEENNNFRIENYTTSSSKLFTSKLHQFDNLPEPRNATEEELEAFYSKPYDFYIPDNIDDFGKSINQDDNGILINKGDSKNLSKVFNELQISSKADVQNNYYGEEIMEQQIKNVYTDDDEDEVYNNPNLHSGEQDELELPDNI
ncbi:kinase-like domain-containing protein [Rhizophagus clarus]|uniref:Kinase-like domain-containing protein n=1 Tax=Rhizophagus clarus TaxID=94130 RepID=A0A8H3KW37_9GLOM|nr:kinase-like domain-containing protein [Rhizophagus clarus]